MGDGEERKQKECGKGDRLSTDFLHAPTEALLPRNIIIQAAYFNPLNAELNPISYLLALLGAHHFPHVSRIRVKSLTLRLLTSYIYIYMCIYIYIYIYIYGAPILDVSRLHTTTHHSR